MAKKLKTSPRSSEIDLLRNRINKTSQQCENWTATLIEELSKSVYMGRSMLEEFIKKFELVKRESYSESEILKEDI